MKQEARRAEYINHGTDEQMEIYGFTKSTLGLVITWLFIVLTFGFLRLVFYWKPNWMLLCTHRRCAVSAASSVLLKDKYQQWFVEEVRTLSVQPTATIVNDDDDDDDDDDVLSRIDDNDNENDDDDDDANDADVRDSLRLSKPSLQKQHSSNPAAAAASSSRPQANVRTHLHSLIHTHAHMFYSLLHCITSPITNTAHTHIYALLSAHLMPLSFAFILALFVKSICLLSFAKCQHFD